MKKRTSRRIFLLLIIIILSIFTAKPFAYSACAQENPEYSTVPFDNHDDEHKPNRK